MALHLQCGWATGEQDAPQQLLFSGYRKTDPGAGHLQGTQANPTEWRLQQHLTAACLLSEAPVSSGGALAMWADKLVFSSL